MRRSMWRLTGVGLLCLGLSGATATAGLAQTAPPSDGSLDAALAAVELMNEVPEAIRVTCQPGSPAMAGQVAIAQCSYLDDTVLYARFSDQASLAAAYEALTAGTLRDSGTSCVEGAFEGTYLGADGVVAGRVVCQESPDGLLLVWTDERALVFGFLALGGSDEFAVLNEHWLAARLDAGEAADPVTPTGEPEAAASPSPGPEPEADGGALRQWAVGATASSQYGSDAWSAMQATGEPDTAQYGDYPTAWAPSSSEGGPEWLELTYALEVLPLEVVVHESSGAGMVTRIEARDEATGEWHVLWEGEDPSPAELVAFSPSLDLMEGPTRTIRLSIDTDVPDWNEIDAVELVGSPAS